ncbi:MAG: M23 family metallopeptidase [Prochlorothrix sp.]
MGLAKPSTATGNEAGEEAPLGLELWLSGEEPGAGSDGSGDPPSFDLETAGEGQDAESESPPPLAIEEIIPENASTEPSPYDARQASEASASPIVVIEERASGCTLRLDPQGQVASSRGECSGRALNLALEEQWQHLYGDSSPEGTIAPTPSSPLQVGVQAIGAAMQVSPFIEDYYFQTSRPTPLHSENDRVMLFPLKSWAPITSVFGWRNHPISQTWRLHTGTDLGALWGTPVVAAFSGRVEVADVLSGYGVTVVLDHSDRNQQTLYAHLSEVFVKPGEFLEQGEVLGRVGSTGNSTGPHLHFELREWQNSGWVALDAGTVLATASIGQDREGSLLTAQVQPSVSQGDPASANALQQWISWFLQMISNLA